MNETGTVLGQGSFPTVLPLQFAEGGRPDGFGNAEAVGLGNDGTLWSIQESSFYNYDDNANFSG